MVQVSEACTKALQQGMVQVSEACTKALQQGMVQVSGACINSTTTRNGTGQWSI